MPGRRTQEEDVLDPDNTITRRGFLSASAVLAASALTGRGLAGEADPVTIDPTKSVFPAPNDPAQWPAFREELTRWRGETRRKLGYDDRYYRRPEFAWDASNFACAFVMMCDETFYDRKRGEYTLDAFLDHGKREFGGYDSIVLWHAYPRIGVDRRNQFDFYRDMPGGLKGVRAMIEKAHRRGVRIFVNFNPWDMGTRREKLPDRVESIADPSVPWRTYYSAPDVDALADIVRDLDADGIFLDTIPFAPPGLRKTLDNLPRGVVFEGELSLDVEHVHDHHASWAQGFDLGDGDAPGVLRNRWFERRHTMHLVDRWSPDHTNELQTAWMNGTGVMVWENVFGSWLGWSARDRSILRSMPPVQRRYAALFQDEGWTPLVPTEQPGVYASLWESGGLRLWTLVNRTQKAVDGSLLKVFANAGERLFDLAAGTELPRQVGAASFAFSARIGPRGIGCLLAAASSAHLGRDFKAFLERQAAVRAQASDDTTPPTTTTKITVPAPSRYAASAPDGMVELPAGSLDLTIRIRSRECGFYEGSHLKDEPLKDVYNAEYVIFRRHAEFARFAIDTIPVTNARFAEFLAASGYRPNHRENFLKHWVDGKPPAGKENHPVVWVDLDDARAYAKWAGKRLPTEEEWQYAAQGNDGREWPWGAKMEPGRCNDGASGATTPVDAFPEGRSPFGCFDLCGNVWQWTESERSDGRTRFAMIRGGSYFEAKGSGWYVSGGPRPAVESTKFLLMWPGLDRCATIGFRCAKDLDARP